VTRDPPEARRKTAAGRSNQAGISAYRTETLRGSRPDPGGRVLHSSGKTSPAIPANRGGAETRGGRHGEPLTFFEPCPGNIFRVEAFYGGLR